MMGNHKIRPFISKFFNIAVDILKNTLIVVRLRKKEKVNIYN